MMSGENIKSDHSVVSVIVPVYNAAGHLRRCLDSLLRQTCTAYEVLLINDGSTDDSGSICDAYADRYEQFHVCHVANGGVSAARNTGVEKANGTYITFVDADDYVEEAYLSILMPPADEDLSVCAVKVTRPDGGIEIERVPVDGNECNQQKILNHHLVRTVWGKMFKRSLIRKNRITFDTSVKVGEDTLFMLNVLSVARSAFLSNRVGYIYIKPGYKINKYRVRPRDLIVLYSALRKCETRLEESGYDVRHLEANNENVVGFNLLTLLYLVEKYSAGEREVYLSAFRKAGRPAFENMGLPRIVAGAKRFVEWSGSRVLMDRFLFCSMKLIWLKARILKK